MEVGKFESNKREKIRKARRRRGRGDPYTFKSATLKRGSKAILTRIGQSTGYSV